MESSEESGATSIDRAALPVVQLLLVEDELVSAQVVKACLQNSPICVFESTHVISLQQFAAAVNEKNFDLILLDLNLSDSEGLDTLSQVLNVVSYAPVIVLTGANNEALGMTAVQRGAEDFLVKGDYSPTMLQRSIGHAVERFRLRRTLQRLAVIDELTALYNRRGFLAAGEDFIEQQREASESGVVCAFDLDRFKQINDTYGHGMGDEALRGFAEALRQSLGERRCVLGRLGGDEFMAVTPFSEEAITPLLSILEQRLEGWSLRHDGVPLLTSWGMVSYTGTNQSLTELLTAADEQLYQNKRSRKERLAQEGSQL